MSKPCVFSLKEAIWKYPSPVRSLLFPLAYPKLSKRVAKTRVGFLGPHSLLPFIENKCVYIHIPKVAGVSISESLFGNQSAGHFPMRVIEHGLGPAETRDWFRFAFVRCPWDRVYSGYRFLLGGGMNEGDELMGERIRRESDGFNDFVMNWLTPARMAEYIHFREQFWFVASIDGSVHLDFVGRFEHLAEDYEKLRERLGFGEPLQSLNRTALKKKPLTEVYTEEAVAKVAKLYARDIAQFDFKFQD